MSEEINIRLTGEAGQGIIAAGMMLCRLYKDSGRHVFAVQDYMSRIRGGNNFFQVRASTAPVASPREKADLVMALDKEAVAANKAALAPGGLLVLDAEKFGLKELEKGWHHAPVYSLAQESGGALYANSVAVGIIAALTCENFENAGRAVDREFSAKGAEIAARNRAAARKGYDYAAKNMKGCALTLAGAAPHARNCLLAGNEALALGAISAGCKFYAAYPMSPSTGIMNTISDYAARYGIIVEQAEDELAAVNMAVGASYAGVRAMTASSGGGFALMCEGLSLAAMTETPLVIAVVMRPGPATGFPTRTAQEDLEFVLHAGHGEFARAVYSPGSPEECFLAAKRAFNTAERFQVPALILSDQHLAESVTNIEFPAASAEPPDRGRLFAGAPAGYERYAYSADGVSPRAIPGRSGALVAADSDEHAPGGHITELAEVRLKMTQKRLRLKLAGLAGEVLPPTVFNPGSRTMLCGFGSTLGVLREACAAVKGAGFVHYPQIWPFPAAATLAALKGAGRVLTLEGNATGQLARLMRRETGLQPSGSVLRYDGRPFTLDEVISALEGGK